MLEPDRDQIEIFVEALFRYATPGAFLSLRSFYEDRSETFRINAIKLNGNFAFLCDCATDGARQAANAADKVVFAPPIATFRNGRSATEADIAEGLVLSVECDAQPQRGREKLESILGPASVVTRSGGRWLDPQSGELTDKLHLHWRLAETADNKATLAKLKRARDIAARIVGADPSGKSVVHPYRWPGSWHRKAEPRPCEIEAADPDREIVLEDALEVLAEAASAAPEGENAQTSGNGSEERHRTEWEDAFRAILTGASYHPTLVPLAASFASWDMPEPATDNVLRCLLINSTPHDAERLRRRDTELAKLPQTVASAYTKFGRATEEPPETKLPFVEMSQWDSEEVPIRQWSVRDRLPLRQPALFSGEGATGKTILELQLCAAHVLGRDWLDTLPEPGPAIYLGCEDAADELHRRLADIAKHYGVRFADLISGGLHLICLAGKDALLGTPDRSGRILATPLFKQLLETAARIKPKHIGIDTSADVYGGSEIDRGQVRQFVGLLRQLAIVADGSVVLLGHPSLQGISSGSGLSGSTGWHNSVRARMYLRSPQNEKDEQPDSDLRELQFLKNNYGRLAERVVLRYRNGVFLPEPSMSIIERAAREQATEDAFLAALSKLLASNRPVSPSPNAANYAPTVIAGHPDGKAHGRKDHAAAMERLLNAGKIHIASDGPPSKRVRFLALGRATE